MEPAPELHPDTTRILDEMYNSASLPGTESPDPVPIDRNVNISSAQGRLIRQLCLARGYRRTLEIGFAYGFSTLWILDAIRHHADHQHVAIDPFEKREWAGVGLHAVSRLGYAPNFRWIEDYAIHALSGLIKQGERFDMVFIDGNHRFDDVIVDFYLADQLLEVGGAVVFDDMWMSSVRLAAGFVEANRSYEPYEHSVRNCAVFTKTAHDDRPWHHFVPFAAPADRTRRPEK